MGRDEMADAIRAVSQFLVADVPLGETLRRVAMLAQEATATESVSLTLLDARGLPMTAASSSERASALDTAQYGEGAGPCLEAYRTGATVRVADYRTAGTRWGSFGRHAVEEGVLSSLSLPLVAGAERLGAVNLYAATADHFLEADECAAGAFATQAAVVIANARSYWRACDVSEGLRTAMQTRATIEQAKGIIMVTRHCSPDDAFNILVRASQRENTKLRDIAERLVQTAADRARTPPEDFDGMAP
jgi:GAF domain-containing protein